MMNIRIDDRYAYLEVEVFGGYQPERMGEVLDAMRALADKHGFFSELEIHHGKPENMFAALSKASSLGGTSDDYAFMTKMRRYAVVTDNPGIVLRLFMTFARMGTLETRIFPMHERDHARRWIEEARDTPVPAPRG